MSTHRVFDPLASSLLLLVAFLVLSFPAVGHAQPDPAIGNWKLNLGKSKFAPGTAPMNLRVAIEAAGQGIKVTPDWDETQPLPPFIRPGGTVRLRFDQTGTYRYFVFTATDRFEEDRIPTTVSGIIQVQPPASAP